MNVSRMAAPTPPELEFWAFFAFRSPRKAVSRNPAFDQHAGVDQRPYVAQHPSVAHRATTAGAVAGLALRATGYLACGAAACKTDRRVNRSARRSAD